LFGLIIFEIFSSIGSTNDAVLPVPDFDAAITSIPLFTIGITFL